MSLTNNSWRRYAPEGRDWEPPRLRAGTMERATTVGTLEALCSRAVDLYWSRRPVPALPAPCPNCNGTGEESYAGGIWRCDECSGAGVLPAETVVPLP